MGLKRGVRRKNGWSSQRPPGWNPKVRESRRTQRKETQDFQTDCNNVKRGSVKKPGKRGRGWEDRTLLTQASAKKRKAEKVRGKTAKRGVKERLW